LKNLTVRSALSKIAISQAWPI